MADIAQVWSKALPEIRETVTGVGVWTALNTARPLAYEEGVFVLGLPGHSGELQGHLKLPSSKRAIETFIAKWLGETVTLRVVDGTSVDDWEATKRRDSEARKLQDQAMAKMRAELSARTSWDSVYEQLSRRYAAMTSKSLPQNRARFLDEAVELIVEARKSQEQWDELGERNFARCLERAAQYTELPSAFIAMLVLQRSGEL